MLLLYAKIFHINNDILCVICIILLIINIFICKYALIQRFFYIP